MEVDPQHGALSTVITADGLQAMLQALRRRGFRTVGPTVRDQAIVYEDIDSVDDLPRGWTDEQDGGRYRLSRRADGALFGYAVGPHSWKRFLHPPRLRLWQARLPTPLPRARISAFAPGRIRKARWPAITMRCLLQRGFQRTAPASPRA
ncbi:MAG: hypothetical protein AMXMBFR25_31930 [Lysobacterales bacterium]|jgi:hypothetical protein